MCRGARLICADMATRATAASSVRLGAGWEVMSVVVMPWVDGWRTPCFSWARLEASMERADSSARLARGGGAAAGNVYQPCASGHTDTRALRL